LYKKSKQRQMARITKQKSAKFNKAIIDFAISLGATIKERSEDWRTVLDLKTNRKLVNIINDKYLDII
jgi:hypothetical protein